MGGLGRKMKITAITFLHRLALPGRASPSDQRLLEQGRDPGGGLGRGPVPGVRRGAGDRLPDGLLHVPRLVPGLLGRAPVGDRTAGRRGHGARPRGGEPPGHRGHQGARAPGNHVHAAGGARVSSRLGPHESPWVMWVPLAILAVPSLLSGFWGSPLWATASAGFLEGHPEEVH